MPIRYEHAPDLEQMAREIVIKTNMKHIDMTRIRCVRSRGTKSRRILARCHALSRIFQHALGVRAHYVIEAVSEKFDTLSREDQIKTMIHELMHIPKSFRGGFRHHSDYVTNRNVNMVYQVYMEGL